MKIVITVLGKDRVGIIAAITAVLAQSSVNILDISQTILQGYFTMIMIAQAQDPSMSIEELSERLSTTGAELGVQVHVQHEDIFAAMHRV